MRSLFPFYRSLFDRPLLHLFSAFLPLLFSALFIFYLVPVTGNDECWLKNNFLEDSIKGIVATKYVDSTNHNTSTLQFDEGVVYSLPHSASGLFTFVKPGDIVEKRKGSLEFYVRRERYQQKFFIQFNCAR